MILPFLLFVISIQSGADALSCLDCGPLHEHHHHHDEHFDDHRCKVKYCNNDEFCKLKVHGENLEVHGECKHIEKDERGLRHCYHEMKYWCADYRLSIYHGECVYCCEDDNCIQRALGLTSPTTTTTAAPTPTSTTTTAAPATTIPTEPLTPTSTIAALSSTAQASLNVESCTALCEDLAPDCATTANVCSEKYADLVCKKYCGFCGTTTSAPVCEDHLQEDICHTIPKVCSDTLAASVCPRFCGFCTPAGGQSTTQPSTSQSTTTSTTTATTTRTTASTTTSTTQPTTTIGAVTQSVCKDFHEICTQQGICSNPLGPDVCPKTCNACTSTSTQTPTSTEISTSPTTTTQLPTSTDTSTKPNGHAVVIPMLPQTPNTTYHTTAMTAPTTQAKHQRMCYQCGNYSTNDPCTMAELTLGNAFPCPSGFYCMTDVYNTRSGDVEVIKRCVEHLECTRKWYDETSDRSACTKYDSYFLVLGLSCHFCCKEDGCNSDIVPPKTTLFRP